MGAGPSREQITRAKRKWLDTIAQELKNGNVPCYSNNGTLTGSRHDYRSTLQYKVECHVSHASNGECAIWPVFTIYHSGTSRVETIPAQKDHTVWNAHKEGVARIVNLWRTND
jgi:hypothetical protein